MLQRQKKIIIFHCNSYDDGNGDIGNLIDVVTQVINHFGPQNVTPYFVITAHLAGGGSDVRMWFQYDENLSHNEMCAKAREKARNATLVQAEEALKEAVQRFKEEAVFAFKNFDIDLEKQTYQFVSQTHSAFCETEKHPEFDRFIEDSKELQEIYASADVIYNIATPFPALPHHLPLKKEVQLITITEHCAASYHEEQSKVSHPFHYVTGIGKPYSGLMVSDLSCELSGSLKALQEITDIDYIKKLGLSYPVSDAEGKQFLTSTLIVPVYLGVNQRDDLAPIFHLVSQSPFAKQFEKIIFHVNKRAYNERVFNEADKQLVKDPHTPHVQLIVGHYFQDPNDFRRVYQLSSGRGVAICSSDKVLELAISCGLLPLYPPIKWKQQVHADLIHFVGKDSNHGVLLTFLGLTAGLYGFGHQDMLEKLKNKDPIFHSLTDEAIQVWKEKKRPILLKNSFYYVLQKQISSPNLASPPLPFFEPWRREKIKPTDVKKSEFRKK
jgi:hypothetical protein